MTRPTRRLAALACGFLAAGAVQGAEPGWETQLEIGAIFQEKNDVQIPNDREGTRFSLEDLAGSGPWASVRADINWKGIYWEPYIFVGAIFFVICFGMSRYSMYLERRLKRDHR